MNATLKEKVGREAKRFLVIFLYVWAILALFALHKNFLLKLHPFAGQLLAIINAAVLGKVILVLEMFKVGEAQLQGRPAIWRILGKSVIFGLMLLAFRVLEESLKGWFRDKTFAESLAEIGASNLIEFGMLALIITVALIPYFFLHEIVNALGRPKLQEILFGATTPSAPH